jgi:UDP-2,3-diacylglucosamine pyrophosphatase LpxH
MTDMREDLFWVTADAHLSQADEETSDLFKKFLEEFNDKGPPKLVILGDLFSSWIAINKALSEYEKDILFRFYKLKNRGKEVIFISGNRDYYVEDLASRPFAFAGDTYRTKLPSGRTIQFEHGDKINLDDRNYLAWSGFSRTNGIKALVNILPAKAVEKVRTSLEKTLAETNPNYRIDLPLEHLKNYAKALKEEKVDILMLGHFHKEQKFDFNGIDVRILPRFAPKGEFCRIDEREEVHFVNML